MNNSKKVDDLGLNTSPSLTDLAYIVQVGPGPSWADKKSKLSTLGDFNFLSRTMVKGGNCTVQASECDKRWFSNGYATEDIYFLLPTLTSKMEVGFFVESAYVLTVYPQPTDKILPTGATIGYGIRSSVAGSSVYMKYFFDGWLIISMSGTWVAVLPL